MRIFGIFTRMFWHEHLQQRRVKRFLPQVFERGIPKNANILRQIMRELGIEPKIFLNSLITEISARILKDNKNLERMQQVRAPIAATARARTQSQAMQNVGKRVNKLERLKQIAMSLKSELGIQD